MKYTHIIVESYKPKSTAGLHGEVHIRPVAGQDYSENLQVRCSKDLSEKYPVGTKFRIKIKSEISRREGGEPFISSHYTWKYDVVK